MKTKPYVITYAEGDGMFTRCCPKIDMAKKLFIKEMKELEMDEIEFIESKIKEDRVFYCSGCEFYTIGENLCCECSRELHWPGRKTFTYNF